MIIGQGERLLPAAWRSRRPRFGTSKRRRVAHIILVFRPSRRTRPEIPGVGERLRQPAASDQLDAADSEVGGARHAVRPEPRVLTSSQLGPPLRRQRGLSAIRKRRQPLSGFSHGFPSRADVHRHVGVSERSDRGSK